MELIEKLAALVPPPRQHLVRYHGVLAPASPDRAQIVPGPSRLTAAEDFAHPETERGGARSHRVSWAKLLARVFQGSLLPVDVTECPACGGRLKIVAALTDPVSVRRYRCVGIWRAWGCRRGRRRCRRQAKII